MSQKGIVWTEGWFMVESQHEICKNKFLFSAETRKVQVYLILHRFLKTKDSDLLE